MSQNKKPTPQQKKNLKESIQSLEKTILEWRDSTKQAQQDKKESEKIIQENPDVIVETSLEESQPTNETPSIDKSKTSKTNKEVDSNEEPIPRIKYYKTKLKISSVFASICSILIGLLVGFILLCIINGPEALNGFYRLLTAGFSSNIRIGKVLYNAAPLLMCGLAVGFAFKTGLFNIGAPGQYLAGAFLALYFGIMFKMPWYIDLIIAGIGGAIWGFFPGILKAWKNVNEVISSIMFNWIGLFLVNLILANTPKMLQSYYGGSDSSRTANLASVNVNAILPKLGLESFSTYMNIGIFIAVFIAFIMFLILFNTTFGYELIACGYNRNASKYAGINEKKNIVLSMMISGALAGIGGGIAYLAGTTNYQISKSLQVMGFNGIPVALLAFSNPIGTIFSSLFVSYLLVGGEAMQPEFSTETVNIIIAVIIYLSAFSLLFKTIILKKKKTRKRVVKKEETV